MQPPTPSIKYEFPPPRHYCACVWGSPPAYATRLCTSLCSNGHPAIQLKYMYSTLLLALLFGCVCLRHTLYNVNVLTPTCTVQYVISCAVNIQLQLYTCFLTIRSKHASSKILNDIGRNSLLGNRKKIAKFLMRIFTCRSTFLYGFSVRKSCSLEGDLRLLSLRAKTG